MYFEFAVPFNVDVGCLSKCIAVGMAPLSATVHRAKQVNILEGWGMVIDIFFLIVAVVF